MLGGSLGEANIKEPWLLHPVGYVNPSSCCSGVFVDEAAEAFTSLDLAGRNRAGELEARCGCWRFQVERTMRPVGVVVLDVDAQDPLELSAVCDQEPIETVTADRADPAFSEGVSVRRPKRRADDLDALAAEDIVEGEAELAVAVVDQEPDRPRPVRERPGKLPSLLGRPTPIRVGAATGEVDAAACRVR